MKNGDCHTHVAKTTTNDNVAVLVPRLRNQHDACLLFNDVTTRTIKSK